MNLGIADAALLVRRIDAAVASGTDIGSLQVLTSYGNTRFKKNLAMMTVVDLLDRTFGVDRNAGPYADQFVTTRNLGMLGIHGSGLMKTQVAKLAMGYDS